MNSNMMRAVKCTRCGPPEMLVLTEIAIPTPKEDEIRIAVKVTAVTASDIFIRSSNVQQEHKRGGVAIVVND